MWERPAEFLTPEQISALSAQFDVTDFDPSEGLQVCFDAIGVMTQAFAAERNAMHRGGGGGGGGGGGEPVGSKSAALRQLNVVTLTARCFLPQNAREKMRGKKNSPKSKLIVGVPTVLGHAGEASESCGHRLSQLMLLVQRVGEEAEWDALLAEGDFALPR